MGQKIKELEYGVIIFGKLDKSHQTKDSLGII
jgi:hypothetical protein